MTMFDTLEEALYDYAHYPLSGTADGGSRDRAALRVALEVTAILYGTHVHDSDIEEALSRPISVDKHEDWFASNPLFSIPLLCELHDGDERIDIIFAGLKGSATKARIGACVAFGQHWEDGLDLIGDNIFEDQPTGLHFFASSNSQSIIMVVARSGNLRTLELRETLSNTQKRILSELHSILQDQTYPKTNIHNNLWDALSVAEVNKRFYAGIASRFNALVTAITNGGREEDDAKMFASRLIGRILFAWFLNQKGFINRDERYLDTDGLDAPTYYEQKLKRLFFETLNTSKDNRPDDGDLITPFLNGGLFEEQSTDFPGEPIPFPDDFFIGLYEHFHQYDFTTDESTPDYEQVAIDPEMLGRIFESLLAEQMDDTGKTARNAKGAFYTPREIVAYMCCESLRQYLYRTLGDGRGVHAGVDALLDTPEGDWESNPQTSWWNANTKTVLPKAIHALDSVRIFDPACGSGAFPMGMLQLLMRCRTRLRGKKATADLYQQKLDVLQNNIFGVDIEPMAVEIARLRVWLSMIVERDRIEQVDPLPNLDFKFVCADSLTPLASGDVDGTAQLHGESIEDVSLNSGVLSQGAFDLAGEQTLFEQLKAIRAQYFNTTDSERKGRLMQRFESIAHQLRGDAASRRGRQIADFHPHSSAGSEAGHAPFFDAELMFGLDRFDVVIGNPPYVQLQKLGNKNLYADAGYQSYNKTGDLYELFYERGIEMLSEQGVLNYITSNKWMRNKYGKELREYLANTTEVLTLIDLGPGRFSSATVDTNIMLLGKGHSDEVRHAVRYENSSLDNIENYVRNNSTTIPLVSPATHKKEASGPWIILTDIERSIKHKMEEAGTPLRQTGVRINYGIKTGINDAFIITKEKRDELIAADPKSSEIIRPVLRGCDIKRYSHTFADRYLITTHNGYASDGELIPRVDVDQYPAIKEWLSSFEPRLSKRSDQGSTPYNLRDCAYMDDFSQPKIVWGNLCLRAQYAMVEEAAIINAPAPFIATDDWFLLGLLNSKAADWYVHQIGVTRSGDYMEFKPIFVEKIPIPDEVSAKTRQSICALAEDAQRNNSKKLDAEREINRIILDLYDFTMRERKQIEYLFA